MHATSQQPIHYPDSDGLPMADNTLQFRWIVTIKENLDALLPDFVGGDLLWYPVEGDPKIRIAPDALVALGRPKGDRGSYRQWEEGDIAPQVVFEVLSPKNTFAEMMRKLSFYEEYGVREFYIYDPNHDVLEGWHRPHLKRRMSAISDIRGWVSPLLGIRFDTQGPELVIYRPDGKPFLSFAEMQAAHEQAEARCVAAVAESAHAIAEKKQAITEKKQAITEKKQAVAAKKQAVAAKKQAVAAKKQAVAAKKQAVAAKKQAILERRAAEREARRQHRRAERLAARLRALGGDDLLDEGEE